MFYIYILYIILCIRVYKVVEQNKKINLNINKNYNYNINYKLNYI